MEGTWCVAFASFHGENTSNTSKFRLSKSTSVKMELGRRVTPIDLQEQTPGGSSAHGNEPSRTEKGSLFFGWIPGIYKLGKTL